MNPQCTLVGIPTVLESVSLTENTEAFNSTQKGREIVLDLSIELLSQSGRERAYERMGRNWSSLQSSLHELSGTTENKYDSLRPPPFLLGEKCPSHH